VLTNHKWIGRCQRLTEMGRDEIFVRTRQAFAKRFDFMLCRVGLSTPQDGGANALQHGGRFFFQKDELPGILSTIWKQLPETAEQIVERAERICRHRFDLLGYQQVNYGPEINWHSDAVHGKRAPLVPWFRVPYLDFDQVGDSKVTWELNRHQHLVTLAKAYRLTEKEQYAEELFEQWYHWQEQNPYPMGINWASSLEVAFRSLSWLWVWHLLEGCSVLAEEFAADLSRALVLHARHIEKYLSTYSSPDTQLIGEGVGLFFVGILNSGLPSAARWKECGWKILLREAQRQVRQDGMHFEQSMYCHTYALDFFLHSRILATLNGITVPESFDQTIKRMLEVTSKYAAAGYLPRFGDDDGGRVFDPSRNQQTHLLDPLITGSVLYKRPDFKAAASLATEELLWLLGPEGMRQFSELPTLKSESNSFALESSGTFVMNSSAGPSSSYQLVIDAGPQGAGRSGHGHADALSVQLAGNGKPLLIDPGTFTYADPGNQRKWFRGTGAHNTIRVDNLSQAVPAGPFEWRGKADGKLDSWITGKTFDFFVGSHTGYSWLSSPVRHRRYVFHLKSRFWVIRDVLEGTGLHKLEASWHFAPGSLHTIPGGSMFISDDLALLAVLFAAESSCRMDVLEEWYSPVYGKKELSPTFRVTTFAPLPVEFTTMLIPDPEVATHLGSFRRPTEAEHRGVPVKALQYSTASGEDHFFFADKPGNWHMGKCASNARFLYCSTDSNKTVRQFVICDGSYFAFNGSRLFDTSLPVKQSEWIRGASEQPLSLPLEGAAEHEPAPTMNEQVHLLGEVNKT